MALKATVSVPATTANLGPGFDCLGLALDLRNRITLSETAIGLTVELIGEGADGLPRDSNNLVVRAAKRLFTKAGRRPAGLHLLQENRIPVGSGLGSSAAAVVGGMLAANALLGSPMGQKEVLELAVDTEGHPDNVTPALFGGLTISVATESGLVVERVPIADLHVAVALPDHDLSTSAAREALPRQVPLADAVFNLGRVGLLVRALEVGDYDRLAVAMDDRLHQPYRLPLIPGIEDAIRAGREAGAAAVVLSGAGPSAIAFAPSGHDRIAAAMADAFVNQGVSCRTWILSVHRSGSSVRVEAND